MILREVDRLPSRTQRNGVRAFECKCDCGAVRTVALTSLRGGLSRSCGCLSKEKGRSPENLARLARGARTASVTHGLRRHPLYGTWHNMMQRCYYVKSSGFKDWGARGIRVCEAWHDVRNFVAWIEANLGPRPEVKMESGFSAYSLDRIDVNGHYEPGNVRWADWKTQAANKQGRTSA